MKMVFQAKYITLEIWIFTIISNFLKLNVERHNYLSST